MKTHLFGTVNEGYLRPTVEVFINDEASSPLACPYHSTALDENHDLLWVSEGILAHVNKAFRFTLSRINLKEYKYYNQYQTVASYGRVQDYSQWNMQFGNSEMSLLYYWTYLEHFKTRVHNAGVNKEVYCLSISKTRKQVSIIVQTNLPNSEPRFDYKRCFCVVCPLMCVNNYIYSY